MTVISAFQFYRQLLKLVQTEFVSFENLHIIIFEIANE